ncbi:MAG: hypothetical protein KAR32_04650, partial [Candidatus Omnitrophica bacterium]|nr:hypothetical protein [Candidatus Omnitrophota bacterium]
MKLRKKEILRNRFITKAQPYETLICLTRVIAFHGRVPQLSELVADAVAQGAHGSKGKIQGSFSRIIKYLKEINQEADDIVKDFVGQRAFADVYARYGLGFEGVDIREVKDGLNILAISLIRLFYFQDELRRSLLKELFALTEMYPNLRGIRSIEDISGGGFSPTIYTYGSGVFRMLFNGKSYKDMILTGEQYSGLLFEDDKGTISKHSNLGNPEDVFQREDFLKPDGNGVSRRPHKIETRETVGKIQGLEKEAVMKDPMSLKAQLQTISKAVYDFNPEFEGNFLKAARYIAYVSGIRGLITYLQRAHSQEEIMAVFTIFFSNQRSYVDEGIILFLDLLEYEPLLSFLDKIKDSISVEKEMGKNEFLNYLAMKGVLTKTIHTTGKSRYFGLSKEEIKALSLIIESIITDKNFSLT